MVTTCPWNAHELYFRNVFFAGVILRPHGSVTVAWLDLDGIHGLGVNDLSLWLDDLGKNEPISRTDYDGDGVVTPADLSIWLEAYGRAGSVQSATSYCP